MGISGYIRTIGRGKDGARPLTRDQARDLMAQVLDGRVTDLEVGAFALAMRIKGESLDELEGFLDAAHERCLRIAAQRPAVVLPAYNGARKLPNLTALLALLLARRGIDVLVHGVEEDAGRVTTAAIFRALGLSIGADPRELATTWERHEPAFMPIEALSPALARLLDVRRIVGVRNSGHTVAKLLLPCAGALRVVNHTHPEYGTLLQDFLARTRADALLLRGTEGEPVADPRRDPRLDVWLGGVHRPELSRARGEGPLATVPALPAGPDAAGTAAYIRSVVDGEVPAPEPVLRQVDRLVAALRVLHPAAALEHPA
jgi:anthranilate phosphoribosyltransferase